MTNGGGRGRADRPEGVGVAGVVEVTPNSGVNTSSNCLQPHLFYTGKSDFLTVHLIDQIEFLFSCWLYVYPPMDASGC